MRLHFLLQKQPLAEVSQRNKHADLLCLNLSKRIQNLVNGGDFGHVEESVKPQLSYCWAFFV